MASRFWVGGTGTWDASDTTHWAASSGGAGGQSVPGSSDTVTLDASSGGGTVTVNYGVGGTVTVSTITMGAFTGTLDFAANDNNVNVKTFSGTGTGVRTLNMGDGTWTFVDGSGTGNVSWDFTTTTNLTFACNASVMVFTPSGSNPTATLSWGTLAATYNSITLNGSSTGSLFDLSVAVSATIATLSVTGKSTLVLRATGPATYTITTLSIVGTQTNQIAILASNTGGRPIISVASGTPTLTWLSWIYLIAFSGGATFNATNSQNAGTGSSTGITVVPPTFGGGIISG